MFGYSYVAWFGEKGSDQDLFLCLCGSKVTAVVFLAALAFLSETGGGSFRETRVGVAKQSLDCLGSLCRSCNTSSRRRVTYFSVMCQSLTHYCLVVGGPLRREGISRERCVLA